MRIALSPSYQLPKPRADQQLESPMFIRQFLGQCIKREDGRYDAEYFQAIVTPTVLRWRRFQDEKEGAA